MKVFRNAFGYSLIEMIIALVLLAILSTFGGYVFNRIVQRVRLEGAASTLVFDFHLARMKAIGQNCFYRIQLDTSSKQYFIERETQAGSSRWPGVQEGIIRKFDDPNNPYFFPGVDFESISNNPIFLPRGSVVGTTIVLKNNAGQKRITLSSQGRVKVQEG